LTICGRFKGVDDLCAAAPTTTLREIDALPPDVFSIYEVADLKGDGVSAHPAVNAQSCVLWSDGEVTVLPNRS
jgi:hypothetical protein